MSDIPKSVRINEEGPREGFQIESGPIPTSRKVELIDALSETGLKHMQIVSFVNPRRVPGMADAEEIVQSIRLRPGVDYTALWLNEKGMERAIAAGRLTIEGCISMCASEKFLQRNQNKSCAEQIAYNHRALDMYREHGIAIERGSISAAFGCNFEGNVEPAAVASIVGQLFEIAARHGTNIKVLSLADTMAWATPMSVKRVVEAVRERYPDLRLSLHLHDTRGMGIANAYAALEMGIDMFDASVAGLGGCPFAGHKSAVGNVCTEDLVFMCEEMGVSTGVDLERMIECAKLAEEIVGHPLPGSVMRGGSLGKARASLARAG
jgi:hydroxymethylglutaryl-CoA lyase